MLIYIILAAVAGFLFFRLRDVLGRTHGDEQPDNWFGQKDGDSENGKPAGQGPVIRFPGMETRQNDHSDITAFVDLDGEIGKTLIKAKTFEPHLNIKTFMDGAEKAYEMIVMAFEHGDKDALKPLLSTDVYDSFAKAIDDRDQQGCTVDAQFVGLSVVEMKAAHLDEEARTLQIDMRYEAELIAVVRNESGEVVSGDPSAIRKLRDVWTYERQLGSQDPNWALVGTAE